MLSCIKKYIEALYQVISQEYLKSYEREMNYRKEYPEMCPYKIEKLNNEMVIFWEDG